MSRLRKQYDVEFRTCAPVGSAVFVCGDFNGWDSSGIRLRDEAGDGQYACKVGLPAGVWHYKFVVDGIWCLDKRNSEFVASGFGQYENLLEVPCRLRHPV